MDINTEKRKRGEGSIWRRKDGIWEGAFVIGIDEETDKKIRKSVIAPTQEECQKKLRKLIREIRKEQNMHKPKSTAERKGITLGEWIDKWYNLYCKPSIRSSTAATYEACIYTHVVPKIGDLELTKITRFTLSVTQTAVITLWDAFFLRHLVISGFAKPSSERRIIPKNFQKFKIQ